MIDFDEVFEAVTARVPSIEINDSLSRVPKFYWGRGVDLATFLKTFKEQHYPFIWSAAKADKETDNPGIWSRDVELLICTRETRKDLLNTIRISEGYSFKKVLFPIWEKLQRELDVSENIDIQPGTITITKIPNYSTGDALEQPEIWDVLRVTFTAEFTDNYNC